MAPALSDNKEQSRFEIHVDDELAGFADYRLSDDRITLTHTEIDDAYEGQGLGSTLASYALDAARERKLQVFPTCPFIGEYIKRHPDYLDLVPDNARKKFGL